MRVQTGIAGFDNLIQGGLPEGSCVVLEGPSGIEKDYFTSSFLIEGLKKGEAILVVLSSKPPASFFEELRNKGFDPDQLYAEGRLRVIDWYSQRQQSVVEVEEAGPIIKVSLDLLNVGIAITRAMSSLAKDKPKRAVVEILSPALSVYDLSQVHTFAQATKAKLSRLNLTTIFIVEKEMHDSKTLSTLIQPFDGVIDLERTREGDKIVRKLAVLSLKGTSTQSNYFPFEVTKDGGLAVGKAERVGESQAGENGPAPGRSRDAYLWFSLGKALCQSGRLEKALVALESCVKIDPSNVEALNLMADTQEKLGRKEDAEKTRLAAAGTATSAVEKPEKKPRTTPRASKIFRILETSESRLSRDPKDVDAHFAKATALAALERFDESMQSLNELTKLDHKYPGLWLLKAKIYVAIGDEQKAKLCKDRAEEIDREIAAEEAVGKRELELACPLCNASVKKGAAKCPSCGIPFATAKVEEAVPPPLPTPPPRPDRKPRPAPEISKISPAPPQTRELIRGTAAREQKGRTNGLTNGAARKRGLTNGLKGRTNGLTNGMRGRTNGLTNGMRGRTNGLTNGMRGRTNGLTNGMRGRTNGLVNGVRQGTGKVNGLEAERRFEGVTNGLVNGLRSLRSGITNGLTNGNGFTNGLGSSKFRRQAIVNRWKLYIVPLMSVMLLLVPLLAPSGMHIASQHTINIDGNFDDWANQRVFPMQTDPGVSPNVRISRAGIVDNAGSLAFYVEVEGLIFQGGPIPQRLMDVARFFIDIDLDATTGYLLNGIGADYMAEVWGWGGTSQLAHLWRFDSTQGDQHEWTDWVKAANLYAAASANRLETEVPWLALMEIEGIPILASFQVRSWDGQEQFSEQILSNRPGLLKISERSLATATISGTNVALLGLTITSIEGTYSLSDIKVMVIGTAPLGGISLLKLLDSTMSVLDSRLPTSRIVTFHPLQPIQIVESAAVTLTVAADVTLSDGSTLGICLPDGDIVTHTNGQDGPGSVTRANLTAAFPLGYLGFVPPATIIDGGFEEWTNAEADAQGESSTNGVESLDIASFSADFNGSAFFYLQLHGEALAGSATPQPSMPAPNATGPTVADSDKDSVPDTEDPMPFDFNNDGVLDADTNHDIDNDGIQDWSWGPDTWLNTTIPLSFPAPYAGRAISIYTGPSARAPIKGEESARFLVDADNVTSTGYSIGAIGAEYMVELRGREGRVTMAGVYGHNSPNENTWAWIAVGGASYSVLQDRLEVSGTIPGLNSESKVIWITSDWRDSAGDIAESATRGTRGIFADGMAMGIGDSIDTYVDEIGQVHIAELNLVRMNGVYQYAVEKNGLAAYFGRSENDQALSLIARGDLQFSWQPLEMGTINGKRFERNSEAGFVDAIVNGNRIEYRELFPAIDDRYTVQLNKVKHDLVFASAPSIPAGDQYLAIRGKVMLSNGSFFAIDTVAQSDDFVTTKDIQVISPSGTILTLLAPYAHEQGDVETRIGGAFRVQKAEDGWLLSMEAPLSWFLDSKREYPVVLDPTGIIDTSISSGPTQYHHQRKIFYDGTYFWAFYYDGAQTQYEYSSDGMSWTNSRTQAFTSSGIQFASVWYHDTGATKIVYLAGDLSGSSKFIYVRRGTISGTTITWGAEQSPQMSINTHGSKSPFICRSTDGYVWIAARSQEGSGQFNFVVARSTNVDDVTAWNAYTKMYATNPANADIYGSVLPLTNGDVYAIWYAYLSGATANISGKKYAAGVGWGSVEDIGTAPSIISYATPSAVVDSSGNVHTVYINASGYVVYRQRTTSWSSATVLAASSGNTYPTISRETSSGDLYVFWKAPTTYQIAAKRYTSGYWISQAVETDIIAKNFVTSIYNASAASRISWAWSEYRGASLYHVRFSKISTTVKSVTIDTATASTTTRFSHQRKLIFDGTYYWAFYSDGTNSYYTYSSNGHTWLNGYTQLFTSTGVRMPSVWYYQSGSTKIVYAVGDDSASDKAVFVRRGSISGTTITWSSEYSVTMSTKLHPQHIPFIARDASGYIWIGASGQETNFNFNAVRSTNTDDVSAWNSYTPLMAADIVNDYIYGVIVPMGSGDMYALWYADGNIQGRVYTASNTTWWTSITTINTTTAGVNTNGPSVVVDSSNYINLVFSNSTGCIIYRQRTTSWGTATVVTTTTGNTYPSITLENSTGNLYVFWISSGSQITAKKYSSGTWSSVSEIDTSTTTKSYLSSIYSVSGGNRVCWLWGRGGSTPWEVAFARIPEFEVVLIPLVGICLLPLAVNRRRRAKQRDIA